MASFNKVYLMGNLTRDPELKITSNGLYICKFSIATTRRFSSKDGNQREETTFVDIDSFGRQAETLAKYMFKGKPIFIEGRLKLDQWENQSGEKRNKLSVILETFQFIGNRSEDSSKDNTNNLVTKETISLSKKSQSLSENASNDKDDIPF